MWPNDGNISGCRLSIGQIHGCPFDLFIKLVFKRGVCIYQFCELVIIHSRLFGLTHRIWKSGGLRSAQSSSRGMLFILVYIGCNILTRYFSRLCKSDPKALTTVCRGTFGNTPTKILSRSTAKKPPEKKVAWPLFKRHFEEFPLADRHITNAINKLHNDAIYSRASGYASKLSKLQ